MPLAHTRGMKHVILAALLVAALPAAAPAAPAAPIVAIDDFKYGPAAITITAGQSVRFVNHDGEAHTVTARGGAFDSGGLDTGDSWTYRFSKPGRYAYFCTLHPWMKGTIIVVPSGGKSK
jgi:plastocyanin